MTLSRRGLFRALIGAPVVAQLPKVQTYTSPWFRYQSYVIGIDRAHADRSLAMAVSFVQKRMSNALIESSRAMDEMVHGASRISK